MADRTNLIAKERLCAGMMTSPNRSESVEMYLKSLAELGSGGAPVAIARVAERLSVTQVSANEMMKRLEREALIAHTPYKGVTLTAAGRQLAHDVIRRQRLWECFLVDHLKLEWTRAHELACSLEHATPAEVTEALAEFLGRPAVCPHGNPIPTRDGGVATVPGERLAALPVGASGRVTALDEDNAEVLAHFFRHDLVPGQSLTVAEVSPLDGLQALQVGPAGAWVVLGQKLAGHVWVERTD